jgi:hypothetical protein
MRPDGIPEESRPPERLDYLKGKYENMSLRNSTVVCGWGSPGNVYRQGAGSCEYGNEHTV